MAKISTVFGESVGESCGTKLLHTSSPGPSAAPTTSQDPIDEELRKPVLKGALRGVLAPQEPYLNLHNKHALLQRLADLKARVQERYRKRQLRRTVSDRCANQYVSPVQVKGVVDEALKGLEGGGKPSYRGVFAGLVRGACVLLGRLLRSEDPELALATATEVLYLDGMLGVCRISDNDFEAIVARIMSEFGDEVMQEAERRETLRRRAEARADADLERRVSLIRKAGGIPKRREKPEPEPEGAKEKSLEELVDSEIAALAELLEKA